MPRSFFGGECFYLYAFILFCSASKALSISIQINLKVEILKRKNDIALELGKRGKKVLGLNIRGLLFQLLDILKISQRYESIQN